MKVHSWSSAGPSETVPLALPAGNYTLVAHRSASPRVGATEPPHSLIEEGVEVIDYTGATIRFGTGDFTVAEPGLFVVRFGQQPRVVELWSDG
jgi:hypothetical protein